MCEGLLGGGDAVARPGTKIEFLLQGSDLNALMLVYNIGSVVCGVDEKLKMDLSVESINPISIWYGLC